MLFCVLFSSLTFLHKLCVEHCPQLKNVLLARVSQANVSIASVT